MGVDTTFKPLTQTYAVDNTAVVTIDGGQLGVTSWRIRAVTANGYIAAVPSGGGAASPGTPAAPAIGTPVANVYGVSTTQPLYLEGLGPKVQFKGNAAYATSYFEVTGGQGGCGG